MEKNNMSEKDRQETVLEHSGQKTDARAIIDAGIQAFTNEFDALMNTHPQKWVAYNGSQRVLTEETKTAVMERATEMGFDVTQELFIAKVQPDMPEAYASWEEA